MKYKFLSVTKFFLLFSIILLFNSFSIFAQNHIGKIEELLKDEFFQTSLIALDIYDLTDDKIIYQKNKKLLLHPASNLKLITSAAALVFLGPNYNFITSVYYSGEIEDSVLWGDIIVVGGGDPDFSAEEIDSLVMEIERYGINQIRGNLYGDVSMLDSLYWGEGWMWDDEPNEFAPHLTPLIVNGSAVQVVCEPAEIGVPAKIELIPKTTFFIVSNKSITTEEDTSDFHISRNWLNNTNELIIRGSISFDDKKDTVAVNLVDPEKYFLTLLKESFEKKEIIFNGIIDTLTLPSTAHLIFTLERPFKEVIMKLNKESYNLSAEMVIRALALEYYGKPASAQKGLKIIDSLITSLGFDPEKYRIVDGSGLSHYNLVSAELILQLLKNIYFEHPKLFHIFFDSLPIAGVDGTLKDRMLDNPAYNNVHAKTGTLSGVSCLSGYLTSVNNHEIAYSILIQNHVEQTEKAESLQDEICQILCSIRE